MQNTVQETHQHQRPTNAQLTAQRPQREFDVFTVIPRANSGVFGITELDLGALRLDPKKVIVSGDFAQDTFTYHLSFLTGGCHTASRNGGPPHGADHRE